MSKLAKYIIGTAVTAIVLFLVWYFSNVVAYILIAAVLAIIGKPLTDFLAGLHIGKTKMPQWMAALITLLTIWIVIVGLFFLFVPILFEKASELSTMNLPQIINSFREPLSAVEQFVEKTLALREDQFNIMESITNQINPLDKVVGFLNRLLSSIVSVVSNTLIAAFSISFITFFFLKESNLFYDMVIVMFPKKYEENISRALNSTTQLLIRYFTGIVAESSIMTVIVSVGLLIWGFGIQNALIIGLFVGILNVIPYIGPIIGIAIGLFIGLVGVSPDVSFLSVALKIAGTILFAQGIDNFVLQPVLYSNRAKAHPLEIFLVILIAGSIAGIWGMLLAIPSYNVIRVFAKEFFNNFRVVQKLTQKI